MDCYRESRDKINLFNGKLSKNFYRNNFQRSDSVTVFRSEASMESNICSDLVKKKEGLVGWIFLFADASISPLHITRKKIFFDKSLSFISQLLNDENISSEKNYVVLLFLGQKQQ